MDTHNVSRSDSRPSWFYISLLAVSCMILYGMAHLRNAKQAASATPTPTLDVARVVREAKPIAFDDLARNTEEYIGQAIYLEGEIIQVVEHSPTRYDLRVNVTRGEYGWSDTVYVRWQGKRFLEDDEVWLAGLVLGRHTYRSIFGASITLPEIQAVAIELLE